jgi:hypothetical protein
MALTDWMGSESYPKNEKEGYRLVEFEALHHLHPEMSIQDILICREIFDLVHWRENPENYYYVVSHLYLNQLKHIPVKFWPAQDLRLAEEYIFLRDDQQDFAFKDIEIAIASAKERGLVYYVDHEEKYRRGEPWSDKLANFGLGLQDDIYYELWGVALGWEYLDSAPDDWPALSAEDKEKERMAAAEHVRRELGEEVYQRYLVELAEIAEQEEKWKQKKEEQLAGRDRHHSG